jgi:gliding motility-associated-like protein
MFFNTINMKIVLNIITFLSVVICFSQTTVGSEVTILPDTEISVLDNFTIASGSSVLNDGELILKSNIINNGVLSYTPSLFTSTVRFEGVNQEISGGNVIILNNVLFNNASTALSGMLQIDNDADFTNGIVSTKDFGGTFFFNELSDHINTSNVSFVNGQVLRSGSLDFVFPIGDADFYRPMAISSLAALNSFSSRYFSENSNTEFPHDKKSDIIEFIDTQEYWELKRTEGEDFAVIEIARDATTSSSQIMNADVNTLHIVRWDADRNFWVDEGGVVNAANNAIRTVSNVTGYGIYTLATISSDLLLPGNVVVYNNLTPNGDGINDVLIIDGIEKFKDNSVQIFNRWGSMVYEVDGYNNLDKAFTGVANSGLAIGLGVLPSGTYYYAVNYTVEGEEVRKVHYLYINGK